MNTDENQKTIDLIYKWFLNLVTLSHILFAIRNILFFTSIMSLQGVDGDTIYFFYMLAAVLGASLNVVVFIIIRKRPFSNLITVFYFILNIALISVYFLFNSLIFNAFFDFLIIITFSLVSISAGMFLSYIWAGVVSLLCGLSMGLLYFLGQSQGIITDDLILGFIPGIGLFFITTSMLICFITEKMKHSETELFKAVQNLDRVNQHLESAQKILSSYIAPQLARKILKGETSEVGSHNRQKLTLFFSDIKDFTATTDSMEAEDLVNLLNNYLDEMVSIAIDHGGTVAQISGDGLFVFFGAPEFSNDEEHAMQCVKMAIAMQKRMRVLEDLWYRSGIEHPFRIRCGINTGNVTVGGFGSTGRKEYTAIGMQVNIAARLEVACEPGKILISHTTWGLIKDAIECREMEPIQVKGFHRPIKTYLVDL